MGDGAEWLSDRIIWFIPVLLSLGVHEWAHAWSAWRLGDDTARLQGRLSLNPLVHVDPVGTLLLPLIGVPLGWAKPVPFEPLRFRRSVSLRIGTLLVAAAGPASNVCLAALSAVGIVALDQLAPRARGLEAVGVLLQMLVMVNVALALFNLLPIPPLDGSRVVDSLLPDRFRPAWTSFCQAGPLLLLLVVLLPLLMGASPMGDVVRWFTGALHGLRTWFAG